MNLQRYCTLLLAAALAAQQPTPNPPALGRAWLHEILDLNLAKATAAYVQISKDRAAPALDRQIATARLIELQREGCALPVQAPDLTAIPEAMRARLAQSFAQPSPPVFTQAIEAARAGPAALHAFLQANAILPQLRPFVAPNVSSDRQRSGRIRPTSREDGVRSQDRFYALQVLRAELEGRSADAADLRRRNFASWQPEAWPKDQLPVLDRLTANLLQWLAERELPATERPLVTRLQGQLLFMRSNSPAMIAPLLDRMPIVSERLRASTAR
ncbi:hypothetical protein LBMAG49_31440 [Planctomycetota bacterium]|nr:hypothetical protein LBMAG49_31440 [Planctomycetota bacterium]